MRQRTVVWVIYHQSECQEEVIFINFPCASEIVSHQKVSVDPPERVTLVRRVVFIYATPHNSWETLELGCQSNSLILCTLYISCNHYFHIDHNAPCSPPEFCITIVVPREIENNGYAKFWGVNKVHCGLFGNGEYIACS